MEDRDAGADTPEAGESRQVPAPSASMSRKSVDSPKIPAMPSANGWAADRPNDSGETGHSPKGRKRRKRRRGRKVFARDGQQPATDAPAPGTIVVPPSAPAVPAPSQVLPAVEQRRSRHELPVFAALDLGTNNCRLLMAIPARYGQFRVIDAFSRIVRLGEGLSASG
ncbi:MAG: Ppx/GppA family phosphatase, partial [Mesorhizobium sp.]